MKKDLILKVLNEGLTPEQLNAVRGGASTNSCTCMNGATYDCGCFNDCVCHGIGSKLICSCNAPRLDNGKSNS